MEAMPNSSERERVPQRKEFIEETSGALLSVPKPPISAQIMEVAQSYGLEEKNEFHISVIASRNAKLISAFLAGSSIAETIKTQIKNDFLNGKWSYELLPEYFLMQKSYDASELEKSGYVGVPEHARSTLIQKVKMDELAPFYDRLSHLTGIDFKLPLAHVTLFSGSDYAPMAD